MSKTKLSLQPIGNRRLHAKDWMHWRASALNITQTPMEPHEEFREFAESFLSHGVKFMVIGGYAVTAHGHPRYIGDLEALERLSD